MDVESDLALVDTDVLFQRYVGGEARAFSEIWRRHHMRMRSIARRCLKRYRKLSRFYEADDLLSDAIGLLIGRVLQGKNAHEMEGCNSIWMCLQGALRQCAHDASERQSAVKRGGDGTTRPGRGGAGHSIHRGRVSRRALGQDLDRIQSGEPGPDTVATAEDLVRRLLQLLDEEQSLIARLKLAGWSIPEIKAGTGLSERTIARRIEEIRRIVGQSGLLD